MSGANATAGISEEACALVRAVGLDPGMTKRVIIDINVDDVIRVYVEGFADMRHFDIRPPMPGVEARIFVPGEEGPVEVTAHDG